MRVDLRTLQPNPLRDFTIDPLDHEAIVRLKLSMEQDGFWGGVVCRQLPDGTVQIAAGHHRVAAALAAGITEADLFVAEDMDDAALIRVYARENATQRGVSSTALAGTVAAAMKYVAKAILAGTGVADKFISNFDLPTLRRRLLSEDGMGREVLLAFLSDIPGINAPSIQHQLANLKYSGDYARLIAEVQEEIAAEQGAEETQELAHQAAQAAARHTITPSRVCSVTLAIGMHALCEAGREACFSPGTERSQRWRGGGSESETSDRSPGPRTPATSP